MLSHRNVTLKIINYLIVVLNADDDKTACLGSGRNTRASKV